MYFLFILSHLFLCSFFTTFFCFKQKVFSISLLFLYLIWRCISFCVCASHLSERIQCAHLFIYHNLLHLNTDFFQENNKFVLAYFYPPCLTQTCFISCVSIFKIVFTELLKTEIRESFQILSFPLPQQLINNSCYFYLFHIPQQPSSSVITATVQILSLSIFYLAYCIGLLTGLCF